MRQIYLYVFFVLAGYIHSTTPVFTDATNLAFVQNQGQIITTQNTPASMVHFKASIKGMEFYITDNGISYVFVKHNRDNYDPALGGSPNPDFTPTTEYARIDMNLKNAAINKQTVVKAFPSTSKFNYYYAQCAEGLTGLSGFHKLTYVNVYPNIDWVIYSDNNKHLKYEFIVHPGGDPSQIQLEYKYADIQVTPNSITLSTPVGEVKEQNLYVYVQETNAPVAANYVQNGNVISINAAQPPAGKTLVIDPPLYWSSYWGSAGSEQTQALVTSGVGEYVFIAGYTSSTTYPTTNPGGGAYYQGTFGGSYDAFIAKFDTNGVHMWSTYYGGSGSEGSTSYTGISIACGQNTDLWMVGTTSSTNLPVQNMGGSAYYQATLGGAYDFFVVKFNYAGVRQHATYVGGSLDDGGLSHGNGADCDAAGNLYFAGKMLSANFPLVNPGGGAYFDNSLNGSDDLCIVKLSAGGQMLWSTYFGGLGDDMNYSMDLHIDRVNSKLYVGTCTNSSNIPTMSPGGSFYFDNTINGGTDAYISRFSLSGVMEWGTYVGGTGEEWLSMSLMTAPDGDLAFVTLTGSSNMPCVNPGAGAFYDNTYNGTNDIYMCRFEQTGVMSWSSYYGSANNEHCQHNLTMDANGNVIICAVSDGAAAPPTFNPGGGSYYNGVKDAQGTYCICQFSPAGVMLWGTFWGGSGHDHLFGTVGACIGVSVHSDIFVCGETNSTNLPMQNPGLGAYFDNTANGGSDGFIAKFNNDIINVPLPVQLVSFKCEPSSQGMNLSWITAHEDNNNYFTLERTLDGENYEKIATIKGSLNSYSSQYYSFLDKNPGRGVNYYRLSQTSGSGSVNDFNVIACNQSDNGGPIKMNVYTITGQHIQSIATDEYMQTLKQLSLPGGLYLVELFDGYNRNSFKYLAQ